MLVLAVEQDEVGEGLWRERRVVQQEVELLEASRRILLDVHQGLVVESHWIELFLVSWRHIEQGLAGGRVVLHTELDGGLEV